MASRLGRLVNRAWRRAGGRGGCGELGKVRESAPARGRWCAVVNGVVDSGLGNWGGEKEGGEGRGRDRRQRQRLRQRQRTGVCHTRTALLAAAERAIWEGSVCPAKRAVTSTAHGAFFIFCIPSHPPSAIRIRHQPSLVISAQRRRDW